MITRSVGARGEAVGAAYLERAGWEIIDRNFRAGRKEIDLVARCGGVVAFVEVKTRCGTGFGHPLESITSQKQRQIGVVASAWIQRFGGTDDEVYRFDAIAVTPRAGGLASVEHIGDAWRLEGGLSM
jgi:putative endonuclease